MADPQGNNGKLATIDSDAILSEISHGTLTKDIALRLGVSKQALRARLVDHPEYESAIEAQCETLLEKAAEPYFDEVKFEALSDQVVIARTRDRMRAAETYAKVICPNRFNAKPANITVNNNIVQVDATLGQSAASLLDQLRTVVSEQQTGDVAVLSGDSVRDDQSGDA